MDILGISTRADDPTQLAEFNWLVDWEHADRHARGGIRWGILAELGRLTEIEDQETVVSVAREICRRQPSVKEGVALVRRVRFRARSRAPEPTREQTRKRRP